MRQQFNLVRNILFILGAFVIGFLFVFAYFSLFMMSEKLDVILLLGRYGVYYSYRVFYIWMNGDFSIELMQITCKELGEANAYITDIAQKTVRERLAEILIHLKNDFGLDENNVLQISLTREELANIVGTATESVIRLLSEFKQDELIVLNGRKIGILDEAGLIRIGNLYE